MSEETFKFPNVFEKETDLTGRSNNASNNIPPAAIIGTSKKGPAFIPVKITNKSQLLNHFGEIDKDKHGAQAAYSFLDFKESVQFTRVLGAGANLTVSDVNITEINGTVKNAGFKITGSLNGFGEKRGSGGVQLIAGIHKTIGGMETVGYPIFSQNDSFTVTDGDDVHLVRGMVFLASGARMEIMDHNEKYPDAAGINYGKTADDVAKIKSYDGSKDEGMFKLVISSSLGLTYGNDENFPGVRIISASLDPSSELYISKVLNTSPKLFHTEQHLLYADFPIEAEIAHLKYDGSNNTVGILSASTSFSNLGNLRTRYSNAKTTSFISQPFGNKEYDLFHFETLDDGEISNELVKVSITDIKRSNNASDPFGTFTVLVRDFNDSDLNTRIIEQFSNCTLNPNDENYIANKIGDKKIYFNFDATSDDEKRIVSTGKRDNNSRYIRVIMNSDVEEGLIPKSSLPFGFRGIPVLKTNDTLTDSSTSLGTGLGFSNERRLFLLSGSDSNANLLRNSIVPPVPLTFKVTKNAVNETAHQSGFPGKNELADSRVYWGIKFNRLPVTSSLTNSALHSNAASDLPNNIIKSYSKLLGIGKLDTMVTGAMSDKFCNNKFTLANVALNRKSTAGTVSLATAISTEITGTAADHMREAAYIRNGKLTTDYYSLTDGSTERLTFASLVADDDFKSFNKFTNFLKFTNMFYGGFDGLNILDQDQVKMNDKSTSVEGDGKAHGTHDTDNGYMNLHSDSGPGVNDQNNIVNAYKTAIKATVEKLDASFNIFAVPGIRDSIITDYAGELIKDYNKALYVMDIPEYDDDSNRLFYDSSVYPSVDKTIEKFEGRNIDNNYIATYFPDVIKQQPSDIGGTATLPASVAGLAALGYNDLVSFPWFAPAGFNRGSLQDIINTKIRLNAADRDNLYEARINPIAKFTTGDYVIFGQKTLQKNKSALDRVNVRRMLLEVKRIVSQAANEVIFELNSAETRNKFISLIAPQLSLIQSQQGIDQYRIIANETNNKQVDIENNRLNCKIILVPTRSVEYISLDFIVTNSGVDFD